MNFSEASGVAPLVAQICSAPVNSDVSPKHKWTPIGSNLSIRLPTVGLAANPDVVSDSPHLTEIQRSLIGHSSLCFSEAHITNSWAFLIASTPPACLSNLTIGGRSISITCVQ